MSVQIYCTIMYYLCTRKQKGKNTGNMITGEIKSKVDQIWDTFWMGGITNSITVLEQMTYLFFMKMLDDSQRNKEFLANSMGEEMTNPVFKTGMWTNPETGREVPYEDLRWHNFKNFDSKRMFNTIRNDVFVFIKNIGGEGESAYSRFMANAIFLIQSERVLVRVVEGINGLDMNNRDTMGDVYEYILNKMAASGNNGQFRTPRHIIKMMVELVKPTLRDSICDPAMGSAGFIVESAEYITRNYKKELLDSSNLQYYKNEMFHGYDTDQTMLRIGTMNLMLHGVDNPDIRYQDSLSTDNLDENKYTLCLANPPFTGTLDKDAVAKSLTSLAPTKKTELLFLALFIRSLQLGGRCASIVPDGVLFGNSAGHQAIRKELVENQKLQAVISMPSGVFLPYAGVSTAVLIFTKTNAGGTDKVWFYDMKADGFTLDQKRSPCAENDIPDIIERYGNIEGEENRTRKEQSFLIPVNEIRENNYDLSISRYREIEKIKIEYDDPYILLNRMETLQKEIADAIAEFRENYL